MEFSNSEFSQEQSFSPVVPTRPFFPSGKREYLFALVVLITACFLCNSLFYGGLNLGFAVCSGIVLISTVIYLLSRGCKPTLYSISLLVISLVITASFVRSSDAGVHFILFCFLLLSTNLGLCLLAGQHRHNPKGFLSLLDVPRTIFVLSIANLAPAFYGLKLGFQKSGTAGKKFGAVGLGLLLSVPLLAAVISLLIRADAAFDGLLQNLPDWELSDILGSIFFGIFLACYLYIRGTALYHSPKSLTNAKARKGMNALTVNTVLIAVGVVYLTYLISQLAYFFGGFSGILPDGYTMAEYARRGFFEMGWLCAINLGLIALAVGLTSAGGKAPLLTKLMCLFVGVVTLFLVVSASAKMLLYIDTYGLTRLRVLTEVIMIWLGLATVTVCIWLFVPKLAYMKVILLLALIIGAAVSWADVDTVVARYNVNAYLAGQLQTVDVNHLATLGNGATPYIEMLMDDPNDEIHVPARLTIYERQDSGEAVTDIRDWNYADHLSDALLFPDK